MSVSTREQSRKVVRISDEANNRLELLADERGIPVDALVEEALELLFQQQVINDFERSEQNILRQLLEETGPSTARSVPSIPHDDIVLVVPVPIDPTRLKRPGDEF